MSLYHFALIVVGIIIGDVYCVEVTRNYSSPWQTGDNNRLVFQGYHGYDLIFPRSTTPWPSLQQRKDQLQTVFQKTEGNKQRHQLDSVWVRQSNVPGWVRNTPAPEPARFQVQRKPIENEDDELREFAEELLSKDTNNAAKYVSVNYQGMTTSRSAKDEAPQQLLTIHPDAYDIRTISLLKNFYDNYILDTKASELSTPAENQEEEEFLDAILSTEVMKHTKNFLIGKGKVGGAHSEFKNILRTIWFNMYSRGGGRVGSSGFEHVFLAELKAGQISGLHNWVYFEEEERNNRANYLGYLKKLDLGNKGAILKYHFTFQNTDKPVGSMFIGTSPELEVALYSVCFILRADRICPLKLNGHRFIIRTYTYRYNGKKMIGSAFPEI